MFVDGCLVNLEIPDYKNEYSILHVVFVEVPDRYSRTSVPLLGFKDIQKAQEYLNDIQKIHLNRFIEDNIMTEEESKLYFSEYIEYYIKEVKIYD